VQGAIVKNMKIEDWLSNLGLIEYISIFKENEITFEDLNSLSSEDLKTELGITNLIDRKKILQAISELNLNKSASEKLSNYLKVENIPFCLFEPFHEFKKEKHPRVKLFWLIDTSEYAIKFIVSILFAEILRLNNGELPDTLKIKIRDHIERPTLGKWLGILTELSREKPNTESLFNELFELNSNIINENFKTENLGGNIENSILILRNQLAHGGGMSSEKAKLLVDIFERQVCEIINSISKALENSIMIAKNGLKCFDIFCNEIMEVSIPEKIQNCADGVWLIKNDVILNLSPITVFEPIQQGSNGGEMIKKDKRSLQVYARSNRDKLVYSPIGSDEAVSENFEIDEFKRMFGLDAERNKIKSDQKNEDFLWDDFIREARLASEDLVGRSDEVKAIKAWLKSRDSYNPEIPKTSWIYGGPGLGKSLLISKIVSDYCNSSSKYKGLFYFRFRGGDARNNRISFLKYFKDALLAWEPLTPLIDANYFNETSDVSELVISVKHILNQIVKIKNDNPKAPKPSFWIFVDGVDEIIGSDRSIVAMFYELVITGSIWTFSGRPENNLNETYKIHNAEFIFQNGLPLLSENDIRQMLIDGLGKIKYDLLKLDLDDKNGVENAFIQKVIEKAQGLPIYVSLLIRDLCSGQYKITADTILPNGLSEYYNLVLDRIGLSSVKRDLPIIIAILSIVDEPLDSDALTILLANNISEDFDFYRKRVDEAIKVGGSLLRIAPTSYNTNGWVLYHQSFRDHVNGSLNNNHNPLHDVVIESKRLICRLTESWDNLNKSTLKTHLFQYGNSYDINWRDNGKFYVLKRLTDLNYLFTRLADLSNTEIYKIVYELENIWDLLVTECLDGVSGFGFPQLENCHIESFTRFFRERAHIISQGDKDWGPEKITMQLALEFSRDNVISKMAKAKQDIYKSRIRIFKSAIPNSEIETPLLRSIKIHETKIKGVTHLGNGNVVSWDQENYISIWSIANGQIIEYFKCPFQAQVESIIRISNQLYLLRTSESISLWESNKREPCYVYESKMIKDIQLINDKNEYSKAFIIDQNNFVLLFDLINGHVLSTIEFKSNIIKCFVCNLSLIVLLDSGEVFNILDFNTQLKINNKYISTAVKGISPFNKQDFIVFNESEFILLNNYDFSAKKIKLSIDDDHLSFDLVGANQSGLFITKHKIASDRTFDNIGLIESNNFSCVTACDFIEPYSLHQYMPARHADVLLIGDYLIRTFFYGIHINVINLVTKVQNHFEFGQDVGRIVPLSENLIGICMCNRIAIFDFHKNEIAYDFSGTKNKQIVTIHPIDENNFLTAFTDGTILIFDTKKFHNNILSNSFNLGNTCVFKQLNKSDFVTLSKVRTAEFNSEDSLFNLFRVNDDNTLSLIKSVHLNVVQIELKIMDELDFLTNQYAIDLLEEYTLKIEGGYEGYKLKNQTSFFDDFVIGNERLIVTFAENRIQVQDINGLTLFNWYSDTYINNIMVFNENYILVQHGVNKLELLEIKHPAPNSV
jgi:hypothetical protein